MNFGEKSPHLWASVILVIGVILATFYAIIVPFGEKPDEPSHMARIVHLSQTGREPRMFDTSVFPGIVIYERMQRPFYYHAAALLMRAFPSVNWTISPDTRFGCVENGRRFQLEGTEDPPPQVFGIRILGVLFVAVSGLLVYLSACHVFSRSGYALSTLMLFMMTPQILFIGTSVSNDGAALLMGAAIVAFLTFGSRINAVLFGLGASVLFLIGIGVKDNLAAYLVGIPVFMAFWRPRKFLKSFIGYIIGIGCVLLLGGLFSSHGMIESWSWRLSHRAVNLLNLMPKDYPGALSNLLRSFWAQFGWMDIQPPDGVLLFWYLIILIAMVGIAMGPVRTKLRIFPLFFIIVLAISGWLLSLGSYSQIQGRFFFPFAPAVAMILIHGLSGIRLEKTWWILGILLVVQNIACITHLGVFYHTDNWPQDLELDAHQCYADRIVLNTLSDGFEIGQTFYCRQAGISAIDVVFEGKHRGEGFVEMTLIDENTERLFRTSHMRIDSVSTGEYTRFIFQPVMKSKQRVLSFRFRLTDYSGTGDLSLRYALGDLFLEGTRLEDGFEREGDIRFVTWCRSQAP